MAGRSALAFRIYCSLAASPSPISGLDLLSDGRLLSRLFEAGATLEADRFSYLSKGDRRAIRSALLALPPLSLAEVDLRQKTDFDEFYEFVSEANANAWATTLSADIAWEVRGKIIGVRGPTIQDLTKSAINAGATVSSYIEFEGIPKIQRTEGLDLAFPARACAKNHPDDIKSLSADRPAFHVRMYSEQYKTFAALLEKALPLSGEIGPLWEEAGEVLYPSEVFTWAKERMVGLMPVDEDERGIVMKELAAVVAGIFPATIRHSPENERTGQFENLVEVEISGLGAEEPAKAGTGQKGEDEEPLGGIVPVKGKEVPGETPGEEPEKGEDDEKPGEEPVKKEGDPDPKGTLVDPGMGNPSNRPPVAPEPVKSEATRWARSLPLRRGFWTSADLSEMTKDEVVAVASYHPEGTEAAVRSLTFLKTVEAKRGNAAVAKRIEGFVKHLSSMVEKGEVARTPIIEAVPEGDTPLVLLFPGGNPEHITAWMNEIKGLGFVTSFTSSTVPNGVRCNVMATDPEMVRYLALMQGNYTEPEAQQAGTPSTGPVPPVEPAPSPTPAAAPVSAGPVKSEGVVDNNQIKVAVKSLQMNQPMLGVMGGPSKPEAVKILRGFGWSDGDILNVLKKAGHSSEEIKSLMRESVLRVFANRAKAGWGKHGKDVEEDSLFKGSPKTVDLVNPSNYTAADPKSIKGTSTKQAPKDPEQIDRKPTGVKAGNKAPVEIPRPASGGPGTSGESDPEAEYTDLKKGAGKSALNTKGKAPFVSSQGGEAPDSTPIPPTKGVGEAASIFGAQEQIRAQDYVDGLKDKREQAFAQAILDGILHASPSAEKRTKEVEHLLGQAQRQAIQKRLGLLLHFEGACPRCGHRIVEAIARRFAPALLGEAGLDIEFHLGQDEICKLMGVHIAQLKGMDDNDVEVAAQTAIRAAGGESVWVKADIHNTRYGPTATIRVSLHQVGQVKATLQKKGIKVTESVLHETDPVSGGAGTTTGNAYEKPGSVEAPPGAASTKSKSEPQKEPEKPTENVPTNKVADQEKGGATGGIPCPNCKQEIPKEVVKTMLGKFMSQLGAQMSQGGEVAKPDVKGKEEPEEEPKPEVKPEAPKPEPTGVSQPQAPTGPATTAGAAPAKESVVGGVTVVFSNSAAMQKAVEMLDDKLHPKGMLPSHELVGGWYGNELHFYRPSSDSNVKAALDLLKGNKTVLNVRESAPRRGKLLEQDTSKVADYLTANPNPSDDEFHKWAQSQGMVKDEAEEVAYELATVAAGLFLEGKSKGAEPEGLDPKELEMGIKVEKEHADDEDTRRKIALDHLTEIPDYYTRLAKMEAEAKGGKNESMREGKEVTLTFKTSPLWDEFRVRSWLALDGWVGRGITLVSVEYGVVVVRGPADGIRRMKYNVGGTVKESHLEAARGELGVNALVDGRAVQAGAQVRVLSNERGKSKVDLGGRIISVPSEHVSLYPEGASLDESLAALSRGESLAAVADRRLKCKTNAARVSTVQETSEGSDGKHFAVYFPTLKALDAVKGTLIHEGRVEEDREHRLVLVDLKENLSAKVRSMIEKHGGVIMPAEGSLLREAYFGPIKTKADADKVAAVLATRTDKQSQDALSMLKRDWMYFAARPENGEKLVRLAGLAKEFGISETVSEQLDTETEVGDAQEVHNLFVTANDTIKAARATLLKAQTGDLARAVALLRSMTAKKAVITATDNTVDAVEQFSNDLKDVLKGLDKAHDAFAKAYPDAIPAEDKKGKEEPAAPPAEAPEPAPAPETPAPEGAAPATAPATPVAAPSQAVVKAESLAKVIRASKNWPLVEWAVRENDFQTFVNFARATDPTTVLPVIAATFDKLVAEESDMEKYVMAGLIKDAKFIAKKGFQVPGEVSGVTIGGQTVPTFITGQTIRIKGLDKGPDGKTRVALYEPNQMTVYADDLLAAIERIDMTPM